MATDKQDTLVIRGNQHIPSMTLKASEVNHLRRLLAWIRVDFYLDRDMQRGFVHGATESVAHGADPQRAGEVLQHFADKVNSVPVSVREAVASLAETLLAHDVPAKGGAAVALTSGFNQVQGLKDVLTWMTLGVLAQPTGAAEVSRPIPIPAYIHSAIKMLGKGIAAHEAAAGIVDTTASPST